MKSLAKKSELLLLSIFLTLCGLTFQVSHAVEFHLEGEIHKILHAVSKTNRAEFSFSYRDGLWLVRVEKDTSFRQADYVEAGTDGTNIYEITSIEGMYRSNQVSHSGFGTIIPAPIPDWDRLRLPTVLWLSYVSHQYLSTNNSPAYIYPIYYPIQQPFQEKAKQGKALIWSQWQLLRQEVPFLSHLVFYGDIITASGTNALSPPPKKSSNPILATNATFQVLQYTNLNSLIFPQRLIFTVIGYSALIRTGGPLYPNISYEVIATNLSDQCSLTQFVPSPKGPTKMGERRFVRQEPSIQGFSYAFTGGWPSTLEASNRPEYAHALEIAKEKERREMAKRRDASVFRFIFGTIVLITMIFAAMEVRRFKQKTKEHNSYENQPME